MGKAMKDAELAEFFHQAALLVSSGVAVGEAAGILAETESAGERRAALARLSEETMSGCSLAQAAGSSGLFPPYALAMLGAAESAGAVEQVLGALSAYYTRAAAARRELRAAVGYPLLMLAAVTAVLAVFLIRVLPIFESVFARIGADIGGAARLFLRIGAGLSRADWLLWLLLGVAVAAALCALVPTLRAALARAASRTATGRTVAAARAAQLLALGLTGTGDADRALRLACELEPGGNARLADCRRRAAAGDALSKAARDSGLFSAEYCRLLWLGERAGKLESMMREVAARADAAAAAAIARLSSGVEAAVVTAMLLGIGFLLLSVMLPLAGIMTAL